MSTTQPPSSVTKRLMVELNTENDASFGFWLARQLLRQGKVAQVQVQRRTPYPVITTTAAQTARSMLDLSKDVRLMLATGEFWATTRVNGARWSQLGVPEARVSFDFAAAAGVAASSLPWSITLPPIPYKDYAESVREVRATMAAAPAGTLALVQAQAEQPFLFFPMALGMVLQPAKWTDTSTVVDVVASVVSVAVHRLKSRLLVPRPTAATFGLGIEALIGVPSYSAFPSGHATLCAALATVLGDLVEADTAQQMELDGLAAEIARNRERAGLHCSLDSANGLLLGKAIGGWMLQAARLPNDFGAWSVVYADAAAEWLPPVASPGGAAPAAQP